MSSPDRAPALKRMGRLNRWDTPWFNAKLLSGVAIIGAILLTGILGRYFWNTDLAYAASSPLNLPPAGFEYETATGRQFAGTWDHPLGTENSGRDMLALMIMAAPNSFLVGVIAAGVGMSVGIILGFSAGFLGGRADDLIRLMSDVTVTIPALMVLIVIHRCSPRLNC
jgi:peptide/nickel transport system permease protein